MTETLKINTGTGLISEDKVEALPIFGDNHPTLSEVVPEFTGQLPNAEMSAFIRSMKFTRKAYAGVGLAANQCGYLQRLFVLGHEDFDMVCINPKIISASADLVKDNEGCLSFPALYVKIDRPSWLEVEFLNEEGKLIRTRLEGLTARCFAHELDHLNGIKFTSHVGALTLKMAQQKAEKRIKKHLRARKK